MQMNMRIEPLKPWHLECIELQDAQAMVKSELCKPGYYEALICDGQAYALVDEKVVLGCYGVQMIWPGRGLMWTLLSNRSSRYMLLFHRLAKGFLAQVRVPRLEAYVSGSFPQGERWARMLGFVYEGTMRCFFPDGGDALMFSRLCGGFEDVDIESAVQSDTGLDVE